MASPLLAVVLMPPFASADSFSSAHFSSSRFLAMSFSADRNPSVRSHSWISPYPLIP